jgi:hypothetical protein
MPPRSKVYELPADLRAELDRRLIDSGFGGYRDLAAWLNEQGYQIGKSALHTYGSDLEEQWSETMGRLHESGRLAEQYVAGAEDGAGLSMTKTSIRMAQDAILRLQINLQRAADDPAAAAKTLSAVTRALADIGRLDLSIARWDDEQRQAAAAEAAADLVRRAEAATGDPAAPLTAERLREITREVYGV